ncbi:MAG: hypothetical protein U5L11_02390 [Arhodomonas sp.]|nr:hypothetical protein [Arhodomonas sp.]
MPETDRIALLFATSGHSGVDRVIANLLPEFGKTSHRFDLLVIGKHGPAVPADLRAISVSCAYRCEPRSWSCSRWLPT